MRRIDEYMRFGGYIIERPSDVKEIIEKVPELIGVPPIIIEKMWSDYSNSLAAGWLIVSDDQIESFRGWLLG